MYKKKTFNIIREEFRQIIKGYFPNYQDWDRVSVLPLFADLVAYLGDSFNYYQDSIFNELLTENATDKDILRRIARARGYKFKGKKPAIGYLDIEAVVPDIPSNNSYLPKIGIGSIIISDIGGIKFTLLEDCDFSKEYDSSEFYEEIGGTSYYKVKKLAKIIGAVRRTIDHEITETKQYYTIVLSDNNKFISEIINLDNMEEWYKVSHLSQDLILIPKETNVEYDYDLIDLIQDDKKFTVEKDYDNTNIIFGAGNYTDDIIRQKEYILLPPFGRSLTDEELDINLYSMLTQSNYGRIPQAGTKFRITYYETDGALTNVPPTAFSTFGKLKISFPNGGSESDKKNYVIDSLKGVSKTGFSTGSDEETVEQLKSVIKTISNSQQRMVTKSDFELATLELPERYGNVYKAKAIKANTLPQSKEQDYTISEIPTIELYILGKDNIEHLIVLDKLVKENLSKWLSLYRMLSDGITIKDAYIINFGLKLTILVAESSVTSQVELDVLNKIEEYFSIDKWKIGQNINTSDFVNYLFTNCKGLYDVKELSFYNLTSLDGNYSNYSYNFEAAKKGNIIGVPDNCIIELKYFEQDIKIRSVE